MRLFIAVDLPTAEKQQLAGALRDLASYDLPIRWLAAETFHITVKFLGEVAEAQQFAVRGALQAAAGAKPFQLRLRRFGAFPSLSHPSVFWVGVDESEPLALLHDSVEAAFQTIGFEREQRSFKPHITVGKLQPGAAIRDRTLMDRMAGEFKYKAEVEVRTVELMRSYTGPRGARYEILESLVFA